MKLTYTEDYNDIARKSQVDEFIDALYNKALSPLTNHRDAIIQTQMDNCRIDDRIIDNDKFQVILTVDFERDK
jgi:hypothetical protein